MYNQENGLFKIGKSKHPKKRLKDLEKSEKCDFTLIMVCDKNIETELHREFKDKNVNREYFDLTGVDAMYLIKEKGFEYIKQ